MFVYAINLFLWEFQNQSNVIFYTAVLWFIGFQDNDRGI